MYGSLWSGLLLSGLLSSDHAPISIFFHTIFLAYRLPLTWLYGNSLSPRESSSDRTRYREHLDAKRPHWLSLLLFQSLSAAGMTLWGGRANERWLLCPSSCASMLSIAETYVSLLTTNNYFIRFGIALFIPPPKKIFKCAILNEHFAFECQDRATLSSSHQLELCQQENGNTHPLSAPCDWYCLFSVTTCGSLPFPDHNF